MNYQRTLFLFIFFIYSQFMQAQNDKFNELSNYFIQDGRAITFLVFKTGQLAYLDAEELARLQKHILARQGYIFPEAEWKNYFSQFDWYEARNAEIELSPTDEKNLALIQAFQNAEKVLPSPNSGLDFAAYLNGCWHQDSDEKHPDLPNRFSFYAIDKSFDFKGDLLEKMDKRKLNFSGRFYLPAQNQIEFEIITKDKLSKVCYMPYRDKTSGKEYRRIGLKIETIHLDKETGYEYETLSMSDLSFVNLDGQKKAFIKIGDEIYWQTGKSPESCD